MLQDNKHSRDTDWMTRRDALRDRMPPHMTDDTLQKKLEEVDKVGGVWDAESATQPPLPSQQRRVLEELDQRRREDFRRYEMQMEHQRRQKLQEMDEKRRLKAEEE